jgi:hypothetical protein
VFYFGNAIGDSGTGNTDEFALVTAIDYGAVRDNPHNPGNPAAIDDFADYNRDTQVNAIDYGLVRDNPANPGNALKFISVPLPAVPQPAEAQADPAATYDAALADLGWLADLAPTTGSNAGSTSLDAVPAEMRWLGETGFRPFADVDGNSGGAARLAVEKLLATL